MQVLWFKRVTDRYLDVPLRWFDEHPTGELLAHADADCERVDDGHAAAPVLARRGAAHRRVDGAARHRRLGAPRRRDRPVPRPGRPQQRLHEAGRAAGRGGPGPGRRRVERGPRELRGRAAREDARARGARGRAAAGARRGPPSRAADRRSAAGRASNPASTPSRTSAPSRCSGSAPGGCPPARITTGELVQAMALFAILGFPFRIVGFLLEELPRAVVAHDRITGVLAAPVRRRTAGPHPLPPGPSRSSSRTCRFGYDDTGPVLDGLTAHVGAGRGGRAGRLDRRRASRRCARSSCASWIPTPGTIRLGGVPLDRRRPRRAPPGGGAGVPGVVPVRRHRAGEPGHGRRRSPTTSSGPPSTSLGPARSSSGCPDGLDEVIGERGVTLSGGQRQRIALARALLRRPRLLLLDDATSAVDATVERAILDRLRDGVAATTIVVAHRVSTIALADRVLLLDGGRIAATGTHQELLAVPAYAALGPRLRGRRRHDAAAPSSPLRPTSTPSSTSSPTRRRRAATTTSGATPTSPTRRRPSRAPVPSPCCAAAWR